MHSLSRSSLLLLLVCALSAAAFVASIAHMPYPGSVVLKVVPIAALMLLATVSLTGSLRTAILSALLFSAVGDISLEMGIFVAGLSAFLVAQLVYAAIFFGRREYNARALTQAAAVALVMVMISGYILPHTDAMKIPVALYMTAIASMGLAAALHARPSALIITGAVAFIISDSLIGINRFVQPFDSAREWIMVTYYLAQVLLVCGVIRFTRSGRHD